MFNNVFFSSLKDEYTTPLDLFNKLDSRFHFTLDPCSTNENHLCEKYYTIEKSGLSYSWVDEVVFCNPPYSRIKTWVYKCFHEAKYFGTKIVLLIPARTDTKYFHDYIYKQPFTDILFLKGRLKFNNLNTPAPFPSMLVFYNLKSED